MSEQEAAQENFIIEEEYPDHHFRTELPNIVEELPLTDIQFRIYWAIKRIAGDKGKSWHSMESIAKKCRCGIRAVQNNLPFLAEKFEVLENRPLIKIQKRNRANGASDTNLISIVNIWDLNGKLYREKFKNPEGGEGAPKAGGRVHQVRGEGAPNAPKEETEKKNSDEEPIPKRTEITETNVEPPTPKPPISVFPEQSLSFSIENKGVPVKSLSFPKDGKKDWAVSLDEEGKILHAWALEYQPPQGEKLDSGFITFQIKEVGAEKFYQAVEYCIESLKKSPLRGTFGGFVRSAIKSGWKLPGEKERQCREYAMKRAKHSTRLRALQKYVSIEEMSWDLYYHELPSFEAFKEALDQKLEYFEPCRQYEQVGSNY